MCIKGNMGIKFKKFKSLVNKFEYLFGEDQGRYIVEIDKNNINKVTEILKNNSVHFDELGILKEKDLEV